MTIRDITIACGNTENHLALNFKSNEAGHVTFTVYDQRGIELGLIDQVEFHFKFEFTLCRGYSSSEVLLVHVDDRWLEWDDISQLFRPVDNISDYDTSDKLYVLSGNDSTFMPCVTTA